MEYLGALMVSAPKHCHRVLWVLHTSRYSAILCLPLSTSGTPVEYATALLPSAFGVLG